LYMFSTVDSVVSLGAGIWFYTVTFPQRALAHLSVIQYLNKLFVLFHETEKAP